MTYDQYVQAMQTMLVVPLNNSDENFQRIIPRMIEYAELRLYREMDFLTSVTSQTGTFTAGNRSVAVPNTVVVLQSVNVITPVGVTPDNGTRTPLQRVSAPYMDTWWPSATSAPAPSVPKYYTVIGNGGGTSSGGGMTAPWYTMRVAPTPDTTYPVEFVGTIRPAPLSPSNTTTFISVNLPDLFVAASMVFGVGYQRDFGAQSSDPAAGLAWEKVYTDLRDGLNVENLRQKAQSAEWNAVMPSQMANQALDRVS